MLRYSCQTLLSVLLLLPVSVLHGEDSPAAKRYQELLAEYEEEGGTRIFAKQFLKLAASHPKDPAAADALLWVVRKVRGRAETTQAIDQLQANHLNSQKLATAADAIARSRALAGQRLLRVLLEKSPHSQVRAAACYYLAAVLDTEANLVDQLKESRDLAPRVLQYYGKEYGKHLSSLDAGKLAEQREQVYETMLKSFADEKVNDVVLGTVAERALFAIRHLSVGRVAPEIDGEDISGKSFKLSDYRGKVVLLTFWGHW